MSRDEADARAVEVARLRRAYTRVEVRAHRTRPAEWVVLAWIGGELAAYYG